MIFTRMENWTQGEKKSWKMDFQKHTTHPNSHLGQCEWESDTAYSSCFSLLLFTRLIIFPKSYTSLWSSLITFWANISRDRHLLFNLDIINFTNTSPSKRKIYNLMYKIFSREYQKRIYINRSVFLLKKKNVSNGN